MSDFLLMKKQPLTSERENILLVRKTFLSFEKAILVLFGCSFHKPGKSQMLSWTSLAEKEGSHPIQSNLLKS